MESEALSARYVLGVDLGTTSVKVVLLESQSRRVLDSCALPTKADVPSDIGPHGKEQDVGRILSTLDACIAALPRDRLQKVIGIGVSGQMHGVVFWKAETGCEWVKHGGAHLIRPKDVSQLVTWQDGRCRGDFLSALPQPDAHLSVATGFGCATICWYRSHRPDFLADFTAAGTIQDYVVATLCGLKRPVMSVHNAASWGYFNTCTGQWNVGLLRQVGFPVELLPEPAESGTTAGSTSSEWHGIPAHTPVGVALGDFQCSVYSCMAGRTDAVLNISTSAQLTFALPADFEPPRTPDPLSPVSYFPYFDGTYLAVAASLNGGNVMATFVGMLAQWTGELGVDLSDAIIYSRLIQAALGESSTDLKVCPTILGERHDTSHLGLVSNISASNVSLGQVTRAVCRGIVNNLCSMLPPKTLLESGVRRVMGSGSALSRNEVLRQEVERAFPLPVIYGKDVDSAAGVAMVMNDRIDLEKRGSNQNENPS
ncbi:sedoheptulokinase isoform X1 [Lepisosteus oculatus]|uniref:sedoheptulokinase isoform X1 n=1 Tax=Lepisosteus oculatus TaxID=7918 RepID=UPI00371ABE12